MLAEAKNVKNDISCFLNEVPQGRIKIFQIT